MAVIHRFFSFVKSKHIFADHVCDKMGLLMDLATGKSVTMQNANACGGKSSDAVILKHCQAPPFSKWKKGIQVFILSSR